MECSPERSGNQSNVAIELLVRVAFGYSAISNKEWKGLFEDVEIEHAACTTWTPDQS